MKALLTREPGGWDATQLVEAESPSPQADEVLVEIHHAGINPADDFQIRGMYPGGPEPPFVAGRDGSGVVIQAGSSTGFHEGMPVLVLQHAATDLARGTFCRRQVFSPHSLVEIPPGWSLVEAAAAPLVYLTAWRALVDLGQLQTGDGVVVTGASGGVGSAAVQLAHRLGAVVVALSRSEEKQRKLRDFGADFVFSPSEDDLKKKVSTALQGRGARVVVENVGGPSLETSVHFLGERGKVCVVGLLAGVTGTIPIPSLLFKQTSVEGVLVSGYTAERSRAAWTRIVETLRAEDDRPIIDSCFPISDYSRAFERLRESPFGKVVLSF